MTIQPNRFNDPALGQAFANIASLFAPASPQDMAAAADAQAKKAQAERLSWLWSNPNDPLADRRATMAGVYAPTQSYYSVDQGEATARRGQDIGAQTTLATNAADNTRALNVARIGAQADIAGQYMTPLAQGATQPGLPGSIAAQFGMAEFPRAMGAPVPLSETQQKAAERQRLIGTGQLSDTYLLDAILGEQAPVKVATPEGPVFSTPGQAARTGAPAYVDQGSQPAPDVQNYQTMDGRTGTAVYTTDKGWVDTQTREPLPAGTQTFKAATTGGTDQALGGTNSNKTLGERTVALADYADQRAGQYEKFLAANPGVAGLPGVITGFAQDLGAGVRELAATYGDQGVPVEAITNLTDQVARGSNYDPAIREALNRAAELAYIQAQLGDPGGEVNVKEWERLYSQFIGNLGGNAAVAGPLRAFREQTTARRIYGENLINGNRTPYPEMPLPGGTIAPPPAAPPLDLQPSDLQYLGVQP